MTLAATDRHEGVDGDCLAQASLFAAFAELVGTYGEEAVATFVEGLAGRVRVVPQTTRIGPPTRHYLSRPAPLSAHDTPGMRPALARSPETM